MYSLSFRRSFKKLFPIKTPKPRDGLVVIGADPCPSDREFESKQNILDGPFFICFKTVLMFEKTENKRKRVWR